MKRCEVRGDTRSVVRGAWLRRWQGRLPAPGFTLVELIAVLALLGVLLGVSGIAIATLDVPRQGEAASALHRARTDAIRTGRPTPVSVAWPAPVDPHVPRPTPHVLFLPDGSARGPGIEPLTGRPRAER